MSSITGNGSCNVQRWKQNKPTTCTFVMLKRHPWHFTVRKEGAAQHGMERDISMQSNGNVSIASLTMPPEASNGVMDAKVLVDELISLVEKTEGGTKISESNRKRADEICDTLAEIDQGSRPLRNDLIFGNYEVAYVSKGSRQYGQPAGGRFRTGLGSFLFKTTRLCQSIIRPNIATNKVDVCLFGVIPCSIGLRGAFQSIPESPDAPNNEDTVKVWFQPPVLSLPGSIHTRIGPPSSVVLKTTYLDERVRLGLGSRGSRFVFTRGGAAEDANMDQVGLQATSMLGKFLIFSIVSLLVVGGGFLAQRHQAPTPLRALGVLGMLLGAALGGTFWRGGIINDPEERPEVSKQ